MQSRYRILDQFRPRRARNNSTRGGSSWHKRLSSEQLESRNMLAANMLAANLLVDINKTPFKSHVGGLVSYREQIAYIARDAASEASLWFSNGDSDANAWSKPIESAAHLQVHGDYLYYYNFLTPDSENTPSTNAKLDGTRDLTVWRTDGTTAAPEPVTTHTLGADHVYTDLMVADDAIFAIAWTEFDARSDLYGAKMDGNMVQLSPRGPGARFDEPTLVGSTLYFTRFDWDTGEELWQSDGTLEGTKPTAEIVPGRRGSFPTGLTAFQDQLVMSANDFVSGFELWTVNTPGSDKVALLKDIRPGAEGSFPAEFSEAGDLLYFQADDGIHGNELWVTDGTAEGTSMVVDGLPGSEGLAPFGIRQMNDDVFFFSNGQFGLSLFRVDLSTKTTELVTNFPTAKPNARPQHSIAVGDRLFFVLDDAIVGKEVWTSDGTSTGTRLLFDVQLGIEGSSPWSLIDHDEDLLFLADDGVHGYQVWQGDQDASSATLHSYRQSTFTSSSSPLFSDSQVRRSGQLLHETRGSAAFFTASNGDARELWKTDGTRTGTQPVDSNIHYPMDWSISDQASVGSRFFVVGTSVRHGSELWLTDADVNMTWLVQDIAPGEAGSAPSMLTPFGERILFTATDGPSLEKQLWISDGTSDGTQKLKLIADDNSANIRDIVVVRDDLAYFFVDFRFFERPDRIELWRTDGTGEGTFVIHEETVAEDSSGVHSATAAGGKLYFIKEEQTVRRIWVSDGTRDGTIATEFTTEGTVPIQVHGSPNGDLYIWAHKPFHEVQLWFVAKDTSTAKQIAETGWIDRNSWQRHAMTFIDERLFFVSRGNLWTSDGTTGGTKIVADRVAGGLKADLAQHNGTLYFPRTSKADRYEVWKSDGTLKGTSLLEDLDSRYTTSHSEAIRFTVVNDSLLVTPDSAQFGIEPWVIQLATHTQFAQTSFSVDEQGSPQGVPVTLRRTGNMDFLTHARVTVQSDVANGVPDFVDQILDVTLSPGVTAATVWVEIPANDTIGTDKQLNLTLNVLGGGFVGDTSKASLTVIDDDRQAVDFNADGVVGIADLNLLSRSISMGSSHLGFDLDDSHSVDHLDLAVWLERAGMQSPFGQAFVPGDVELDGVVGAFDWQTWNDHRFNRSPTGQTPGWSDGDFNADGVVDVSDFNLWNDNRNDLAVAKLVSESAPRRSSQHRRLTQARRIS